MDDTEIERIRTEVAKAAIEPTKAALLWLIANPETKDSEDVA